MDKIFEYLFGPSKTVHSYTNLKLPRFLLVWSCMFVPCLLIAEYLRRMDQGAFPALLVLLEGTVPLLFLFHEIRQQHDQLKE